MTLEQLGYTCKLDEYGDLKCSIPYGSATYIVDFHVESKSFETYGYAKGHGINHPIDMELNEAIQNKLNELGWLRNYTLDEAKKLLEVGDERTCARYELAEEEDD